MSVPGPGPLIGMVHLGPLPGSPSFDGDLDAVLRRATADAAALAEAGFDALMVENFGDAPFYAEDVPAITIAAMSRAVTAVRSVSPLPVGVNVLRNDGLGALAVAAATGASFIRVNVLSGTMHTDQGPIVGRAAAIARARAVLGPAIAILADVFVKHAVPPAGLSIEDAARDTWERGGADGLVVSGAATGAATPLTRIRAVRAAVPDAVIYVGSGVTESDAAALLTVADGLIVGTSVKHGGAVGAPVDQDRARSLAAAARSAP